ncbi:hypothetical protein [Sphingomonas immobilis]|uniref:DUF202 domain-containing protein n=1 Tax=Sphingomonas immobilis TaxID=3063997 RepID=A0ABT8ZVM9_9SPHN|nr:hypothetical protein [Sphingomonas sp. CA1-15]MDO7841621.1 hypothetical protein [Sphingomonas sp. CA1-15]
MSAPDLSDPVQRAAYQRELRAVAWPIRVMGVGLAFAGLIVAVLQRTRFPGIPSVIPLVLVALGALHMLAGIAIRTKYHAKRMKGETTWSDTP